MIRIFKLTVVLALAGCGRVLLLDDGGVRSCSSAGGVCTAVSSCGPEDGHLTSSSDCGFSGAACCVPLKACAQPEFFCCSATATFRSLCNDGQMVCAAGTARCQNDGGFEACVTSCGVGCAAPGTTCYSDGQDYCSPCAAACAGAAVVACGDAGVDAGVDAGFDAGVPETCAAQCPVGCAAPGYACYSDGVDYCSACVAKCFGAVPVVCADGGGYVPVGGGGGGSMPVGGGYVPVGGGSGEYDGGLVALCQPCVNNAQCGPAAVCYQAKDYPSCQVRSAPSPTCSAECQGTGCHAIAQDLYVCWGGTCASTQKPDAGFGCDECTSTSQCYPGYECQNAGADGGLRCVIPCTIGVPNSCPQNFSCTTPMLGGPGNCQGTCY